MTPNVLKVLIMLEEAELQYGLTYVDPLRGEQHEAAFATLNPNGKMPALAFQENGETFCVFESVAILCYLAERSCALLPATANARAETLQWMLWQASGLGPTFGHLRHFTGLAPEGQGYAVERFHSEAARLLSVLERRLVISPFLAGPSYGLADINLFPWIRDIAHYASRDPDAFALQPSSHPATFAWRDTIAARPAVRRGLDAFAPLVAATRESMARATADDFDRLFGRGAWRHR